MEIGSVSLSAELVATFNGGTYLARMDLETGFSHRSCRVMLQHLAVFITLEVQTEAQDDTSSR